MIKNGKAFHAIKLKLEKGVIKNDLCYRDGKFARRFKLSTFEKLNHAERLKLLCCHKNTIGVFQKLDEDRIPVFQTYGHAMWNKFR